MRLAAPHGLRAASGAQHVRAATGAPHKRSLARSDGQPPWPTCAGRGTNVWHTRGHVFYSGCVLMGERSAEWGTSECPPIRSEPSSPPCNAPRPIWSSTSGDSASCNAICTACIAPSNVPPHPTTSCVQSSKARREGWPSMRSCATLASRMRRAMQRADRVAGSPMPCVRTLTRVPE